MALAKHHEEIGEKILSNLEVREEDEDFQALLKALDQKFGSRLGRVKESVLHSQEKKPWTAAQKIKMIVGGLVDKNAELEREIQRARTEMRALLSDKLIYGKLGKRSPLVREVIAKTQDEIALLKRQVEILKRKGP